MSQISTKLLEHFSNDFVQLFKTEYDYNFIVKVGSQNFKLHSLILYQHSSFFHRELSTATKKNNIIEITLTHTSVESFKILIKLWLKILMLELRDVINAWVEHWSFKIQNIFTSYYKPNTIPVISLLQDNLRIEESEIWDKVIQYGKEQTPNLLSNFEQ
ncbi:hypothetical protein C2G38_2191643 [Gigaspora rosea]|uniref:BTB domain-containing protein n=1 Tax=Gigaspora rosea TaxID=44941 RepID=A0A397UZX0_9GLOM|nr:hypothetical protein C2G38_2191643 [Gigaspora rosea]